MKRLLYIFGSLVALGTIGGAVAAYGFFHEDSPGTGGGGGGATTTTQLVRIDFEGHAQLVGTLVSTTSTQPTQTTTTPGTPTTTPATTTALVISSWGGNWNAVISSSTKLLKGGGGLIIADSDPATSTPVNISDFAPGDQIVVVGTINTSTPFTIDAILARDETVISDSTPTTTPSVENVTIINFDFSPREASIAKGTKFTWINNDVAPHTVTSDTGAFDSQLIPPGGTYSFTFNTAGEFSYHCDPHPFMKGKVIVK